MSAGEGVARQRLHHMGNRHHHRGIRALILSRWFPLQDLVDRPSEGVEALVAVVNSHQNIHNLVHLQQRRRRRSSGSSSSLH